MIDLHTHSLLSDGALLPSELVRRAEVKGYRAIAITDHVDFSNIDFVIPGIVKTCRALNEYWKIKAIPGVEITHVPVQSFKELVKFARRNGAKIVVGHGETISEPVIKGTNRAAIEAGVDILAHPGRISMDDVKLAKESDVYLEISTRKNHLTANKHVVDLAKEIQAPLILNTDAHSPEDLIDIDIMTEILKSLGLDDVEIKAIRVNSERLAGL